MRAVAAGDTAAFTAFYGDPDVMSVRKYGVLTPAQTRTQVGVMVAHWQTYQFGMYAVHERASSDFAGECGLRCAEDGSEVELSYGLLPRFRGRGHATEASRAVLAHAFQLLDLDHVVALSRGDNHGSHRVLEKLGMTLEWRRSAGEHGLVKYRIDRAVSVRAI